MSDPYRTTQHYNPRDYAPDQYGPLTTTRRPSNASYDSQIQVARRSSDYLDPERSRSSHHHHHHRHGDRSHSRGDSHRDRSHSRRRSNSRNKALGATAVGGAAGALLGHEFGHGAIATVGGLVAGAYGARELEKRHEKHQVKKRRDDPYGDRAHRRRRSSGGPLDELKDKIGGFLGTGDGDKRRSKSHVGGGRRGADDDDYGYDDSYGRRSSRDDRHGGGGRSRRDDY